MREAGKVAIGKVVIRSKQQLCALRPIGDAMGLSTMLFGDEVLSPDRLDELDGLADAEASERELTMAQQLIDSLSADFDPTKFKDEYREQVLDLIERKANGEEIAVAAAGRGRRAGARPDGGAGGQPGGGPVGRLRRAAAHGQAAAEEAESERVGQDAGQARARPRPEPRRAGPRPTGPPVNLWRRAASA